MIREFRLIQAQGEFERKLGLFDVNMPRFYDVLDVKFSEVSSDGTHRPWVSVVIGKNGVGKSRLLAGIADVFDTIAKGRGRKRKDAHSVTRLVYSIDGHLCEVVNDGGALFRATVDGQQCHLSDLPLPTKVIALSTTPFDKFRISSSIIRKPTPEKDEMPERYAYLGLRDRSGRASPTGAIFRALEGLFEATKSEEDRRLRIAEVFRFLGYRPYVRVRYEFTSRGMYILEAIVAGKPLEELSRLENQNRYQSPFVRLLERDPTAIEEIRSIGREALARARQGSTFSLTADFQGYTEDHGFFRGVQILRRADLLRIRAAEIQRESDGIVFDLKLASSGELGIVTGFLGLASVIEDGSLVFIDEPEISLHPEWQTGYIDLLLKTFGKYAGCHFVLATHSPLILSNITPENATVVSLDPDRREAEDAAGFSGRSADYLLVSAFQAPGKNNLYLKQEIIKALRLAADGQASGDEFMRIVSNMVDLLPKLDESNPVARLIRELDEVGQASTKKQ